MRSRNGLWVMLLVACVFAAACERRPVDDVAAIAAARQTPVTRTEMSGSSGTTGRSNSSSSSHASSTEPCDAKQQ